MPPCLPVAAVDQLLRRVEPTLLAHAGIQHAWLLVGHRALAAWRWALICRRSSPAAGRLSRIKSRLSEHELAADYAALAVPGPSSLSRRRTLSPAELRNRFDHGPCSAAGQFRKHRQRQHFAAARSVSGRLPRGSPARRSTFAGAAAPGSRSPSRSAARPDTLQRVAPAARHAHRVLVPHVPAVVGHLRRHDLPAQPALRQTPVVAGGVPLPRRRPRVQLRQLHAQHGRLERVEPAVDADHVMIVPRLLPVIAQHAQPFAPARRRRS